MNFHNALAYKDDLLKSTPVPLDNFVGSLESTKEIDDHFVDETPLAYIEEVLKVILELLEVASFFDQGGLHLWGQLLEEGEVLNDKVKVVHESLLYIGSDIVVEGGLDVESPVRLLNFLDPHVKRIKFLFN